jgi:hypothetical protein
MSERILPTLDNPLEIIAAQGVIFICWVELTGEQMRWVFVSDDLTRYRGPVYRGEDTLPAIANLVAQWWDIKKRLGQAD